MDFNEFRRKYAPDEEPQQTQVARNEPDIPQPQQAATSTSVPMRSASHNHPPIAHTPEKVAVSRAKAYPTAGSAPQSTGSDPGGFFGGNDTSLPERAQGRNQRPPRSSGNRSVNWSRLATLPWVDIIMTTLTVLGIIWVIANFDAVTVIIAAAIGKLMQYAIGLVCIVAVIALIFLIFRRRGRYPRWR